MPCWLLPYHSWIGSPVCHCFYCTGWATHSYSPEVQNKQQLTKQNWKGSAGVQAPLVFRWAKEAVNCNHFYQITVRFGNLGNPDCQLSRDQTKTSWRKLGPFCGSWFDCEMLLPVVHRSLFGSPGEVELLDVRWLQALGQECLEVDHLVPTESLKYKIADHGIWWYYLGWKWEAVKNLEICNVVFFSRIFRGSPELFHCF